MRIFLFASLILLSCTGAEVKNNKIPSDNSKIKPLVNAVSLTEISSDVAGPIALVNAGDGSKRLFIIQQGGQIRIVKDGKLLPQSFLDVSNLMDKLAGNYSEKGLLGLAFHPQYKTNGKFYIYYTAPASEEGMDNTCTVAEYKVSSNPDVAQTDGRILFKLSHPEGNHDGGQLAFGKDGFLYIGIGDGGGAGDKHGTTGNGQNLNVLMGKILRIDVNKSPGYGIPPDNPFIGKGRGEIYAYGMRNPWRFSFDKKTGQLFCGDVGQNKYEETDIIEKGKNYGWRIMEGFHCYNPTEDCNKTGLTMPIDEYDHSIGVCIIGGYVYRGTKYPDMNGEYIFGDWKDKFFALVKPAATGQWERWQLNVSNAPDGFTINSFGQDEDGELYVCGQTGVGPYKTGSVYRLEFK